MKFSLFLLAAKAIAHDAVVAAAPVIAAEVQPAVDKVEAAAAEFLRSHILPLFPVAIEDEAAAVVAPELDNAVDAISAAVTATVKHLTA